MLIKNKKRVNIFKPYLHIQTENGSKQKPVALFGKTPLEVTGFVSANQANIVNIENVPKEWNNNMFPLVDGKAIPNAVIQKFGLEEWSRLRISKEMVCEHLDKISNQASFFDRLLQENMSLEFVNIFKPCFSI